MLFSCTIYACALQSECEKKVSKKEKLGRLSPHCRELLNAPGSVRNFRPVPRPWEEVFHMCDRLHVNTCFAGTCTYTHVSLTEEDRIVRSTCRRSLTCPFSPWLCRGCPWPAGAPGADAFSGVNLAWPPGVGCACCVQRPWGHCRARPLWGLQLLTTPQQILGGGAANAPPVHWHLPCSTDSGVLCPVPPAPAV